MSVEGLVDQAEKKEKEKVGVSVGQSLAAWKLEKCKKNPDEMHGLCWF